MTPIRLSQRAAEYLRREAAYLRLRNPSAARRFADVIKHARRVLADFPEAGSKAHGFAPKGARVFVAGDYLLVYFHDGLSIEIAAILHGRAAAFGVDNGAGDAEA
jgi:plasmid stabilization system protein ParE